MGARWALAVSAGAAVAMGALAADWVDPPAGPRAAAGRIGGSGACELLRADRARTPSHACMACHDGSAGTAVPGAGGGPRGEMSHPVAVDYAAAAARRPDSYEPPGRIPAAVPLVDGKVECTTCHDGRSPSAHRIVEHARLCTSCHRM
jgi:hypothetical protein